MSADATERTLVEDPALELLTQHLGWRFIPADELEADRESQAIAVLTRRLAAKLREFNPWLSDTSLARALRAITHPEATSLIEAAEKIHTSLVHRIAVEQDRGDGYGKRSHDVTFLDFEQPERNEFIVYLSYASNLGVGRYDEISTLKFKTVTGIIDHGPVGVSGPPTEIS